MNWPMIGRWLVEWILFLLGTAALIVVVVFLVDITIAAAHDLRVWWRRLRR